MIMSTPYQLCEAFWQELGERLGEPKKYGLYQHTFFINGHCSMAQGTKLQSSGKGKNWFGIYVEEPFFSFMVNESQEVTASAPSRTLMGEEAKQLVIDGIEQLKEQLKRLE